MDNQTFSLEPETDLERTALRDLAAHKEALRCSATVMIGPHPFEIRISLPYFYLANKSEEKHD